MNKKMVILVIFAVYLLTIAIITVMIIRARKEAMPPVLPRAAGQKSAQQSTEKKETAVKRADAPAAMAEKEFESPISGPLLQ